MISKRCKHVPADRAHAVIGGYFCGNDVSVRDWQNVCPPFRLVSLLIPMARWVHG